MTELAAAASNLFYLGMARIVRESLRYQSRRGARRRSLPKWRTYSDDFSVPGYLAIMNVVGPRWNCHAQLAALGPVKVAHTLTVHLESFGLKADSWSLILYDENWNTVDWAGSISTDQGALTWRLPPGYYSLSLRYYADVDEMEVPEITVDDAARIDGRVIRGESSRYQQNLEKIRDRRGLYYQMLHYHVFYHLTRGSKDRSWLTQRFLPVGNPDTEWDYGALGAGQRLTLHMDSEHTRTFNTYVAFYNWMSFPVDWCRVTDTQWRSACFEQPVGYAIRRVRKVRADSTPNLGSYEVGIEPALRA